MTRGLRGRTVRARGRDRRNWEAWPEERSLLQRTGRFRCDIVSEAAADARGGLPGCGESG